MSKYETITFDMDGTLLDRNKNILPDSVEMINEAAARGKIVCVSSGRSMPEIKWLIDLVPAIRYYSGANGAFIYDSYEKTFIHRHLIPEETVTDILKMVQPDGYMPVLMADDAFCQKDQIPLMPSFNVPQYEKLYRDTFTHVENIYDFYYSAPFPVYKINIYTPFPEICMRYRELLTGYNLEMLINEGTYLEITAKGVSKGAAHRELCSCIGVPVENTIAVGDENNDYGMLSAAGFAVAMGNANPRIKELADTIVADNNSGGCAEAIRKYLLD
ncbi:MAG: HAD family hydrolase [Eubacteriales bacterium]|nr:HAD family hydrolase [Eubacteriales bacterium]